MFLESALLMLPFSMQRRTKTSQGYMFNQQTRFYFFKEVEILSHLDHVWIYQINHKIFLMIFNKSNPESGQRLFTIHTLENKHIYENIK